MKKKEISKKLKLLADSISSGDLDRESLKELSDNYERVEEIFTSLDDASKLRYSALQPFIVENIGLPASAEMNVVMKNWGRQNKTETDDEVLKAGDVSVVMKNWGRQDAVINTDKPSKINKDMTIIMKNWGRQR